MSWSFTMPIWGKLSKYLLNWATFVSTPAAIELCACLVCTLNKKIECKYEILLNTQLKCIQNGLESIINYCCLVSSEGNVALFIWGDLKSHTGSSSWNTLARGLLCLGRLWHKSTRTTYCARCLGKFFTCASSEPTPIPPHLTGQDTNLQHMPDAPSDPRFLHAEQSVCHGQSLTLCTLHGSGDMELG